MNGRHLRALVGPKVSLEPSSEKACSGAAKAMPSGDPIYQEVAEILERAAEMQEKAADELRLLARRLRG